MAKNIPLATSDGRSFSDVSFLGMRVRFTSIILPLWMSVFPPSSGYALDENIPSVPELSDQRARSVLEAVETKLRNIQSYRCRLSTLCILDNKREERSYDYTFCRPKLIRMKILQGPDHGSTLVYREGRVVVRPGGLFSFLRQTFEPEHPRVTTIRGGRVDQTDFWFIVDLMKAETCVLRYEGQEDVLGNVADVLELTRRAASSGGDYQKGRFWVERDSGLIVKYELYDKEDKLAFRQTHEEVQFNPGLLEDFFR